MNVVGYVLNVGQPQALPEPSSLSRTSMPKPESALQAKGFVVKVSVKAEKALPGLVTSSVLGSCRARDLGTQGSKSSC